MKVSNLEEVGQMRRRRGISMKMMMIELALQSSSLARAFRSIWNDLQAKSSEKDQDAKVE
jgi:hypothetical protein